MQLFCQGCQAAFSGSTHCPRCGSRLLSPQESYIHASKGKAPPPDPIPSTFANRVAVGTLTALGLAMAFREFAIAASRFMQPELSDSWNDSNTQPATLFLRVLAVIGGGLLAGAGRLTGYQTGLAVGILGGSILTAFDSSTALDLFGAGLAVIYPIVGAIAAVVGSWLWPADVLLPEPTRQSSHGSSLGSLAREGTITRGARPTAWLRIMLAAVAIVTVTSFSNEIRWGLAKYSSGWLNTAGPNKANIIGLELMAISVLITSVFAAAGTGAGVRHGLLTGVLTSAGLIIGANNRPGGTYPAIEGLMNLLGLASEPLSTPHVAVKLFLGLTLFAGLAGWMGGQLYPPLAPRKLWKRRLQQQG